MTLYWGIAISESTFIGDTVTLLNILHCDTIHSSMVDFEMMVYFETQLF